MVMHFVCSMHEQTKTNNATGALYVWPNHKVKQAKMHQIR